MPILLFIALALAVAAWLGGPAALAAWRRARIVRRPFPQAWREMLRRRMPAYARLPADLQWRLKKRIQVLVAEKPFIGCAGLDVSEEMRVLVAAQAALLLLHDHAGYFPQLRQILIYPGAFVVDRSHSDATGLTHETRRALVGESWQQGQVLLAWDEVLAGAADPADGRNVVVHEFAHQLDQERGRANGAPWLGRREGYARWAAVLGAEYAALQQRVARGEDGLIAPYGATDPAEFFAVVSEHFFEQPTALAQQHPALYGEFARYYGVDPVQW
ncbi:MAG: zinc-dependent peptidase [Burkholderiales bacterium]|nr:zinc-dependent peptidase [Burkholderiales bacterium]